jgi:ABC-2 type transport system ATP-binding protein
MIEIKDLQKVSGGNTVIDIAALEVRSGEIATLVGPAGSGKRLLFELLTGKSPPTVGTIRLNGVDPREQSEQFSRVAGVLFEEDAVYQHLTPLANLEFHCRLYGLPGSRAADVLSQVGLGDQPHAKTDQLSSSLLRRLAFGRAILHDPRILLLFEPFRRCDLATMGLVKGLMRDQAGAGKTLLIFTTDQSTYQSVCDTFYLLNEGRIAETYHPEEESLSSTPFKIPARLEDKKVVLYNPADVLYAVAREGRAYLVTADGQVPTQFTLSELEERLVRSGFFRAHRGYLVNLQHVREVIPFTRNSFSLRLGDAENTEIPLSKAAAGELSDLLGY